MSNNDNNSEGGMGPSLWLFPLILVVSVSFLVLGVLYYFNTPTPQTKKVQVQVDCVVSPDMVKYLEHEGHGKVFDEGDME